MSNYLYFSQLKKYLTKGKEGGEGGEGENRLSFLHNKDFENF
jgi:hypothetical protein